MQVQDEATEDHAVLLADEVPLGGVVGVKAGRWNVVLVRTGQGLRALNDRCTHAAARLSPGRLRGDQIMCPMHGARFDTASGKCVGGAYAPLRVFPVREEQGRIIVTTPARSPDMLETPIR